MGMRVQVLAMAGVLVMTGVCAAQERPEPAKSATAPAAVDTSPLVHEVELAVPVDRVYGVFATEEGWKQLGVAQCKMDFRVGGKVQSHYNPKGVLGDEGTIENTIIAFEPGRMVAWRISKPPAGFP